MNAALLAALALKNPAEAFRCDTLHGSLSFRACSLRNQKRDTCRVGGGVHEAKGYSYPVCGTCATGAAIAEALVAADRLARKR